MNSSFTIQNLKFPEKAFTIIFAVYIFVSKYTQLYIEIFVLNRKKKRIGAYCISNFCKTAKEITSHTFICII